MDWIGFSFCFCDTHSLFEDNLLGFIVFPCNSKAPTRTRILIEFHGTLEVTLHHRPSELADRRYELTRRQILYVLSRPTRCQRERKWLECCVGIYNIVLALHLYVSLCGTIDDGWVGCFQLQGAHVTLAILRSRIAMERSVLAGNRALS